MYDIPQIFLLGLAIGFTGALAPGPTLVATINASLKGDWTAGLRITFGHMIAETAIFLLIVLGFATIALPYTSVIAVVGGAALVVFGIMTVSGSRTAVLRAAPEEQASGPVVAGLMTSVANPYFWIWWLTIGSVMVLQGLEGGIILAGAFMIGHWSADASWYLVVSTGFSKGKTIFPDSVYRKAILCCGAFLILFGVYYLLTPVLHG